MMMAIPESALARRGNSLLRAQFGFELHVVMTASESNNFTAASGVKN